MSPLIALSLRDLGGGYEIMGLIGIAASLAGVWMQSQRSGLDSDAEEAVKDGTMTETAARRRITLIAWGTRLLTTTGILCLGVAGWKLLG